VVCRPYCLWPPTLEAATGGRKYDTIVVGKKEVKDAYKKLNNAESREVDLVALGCPHLTIRELGELASLLEGKRLSPNVRFVVGTSRTVSALAKECGYFDPIEKAGGIFTNTCVSCYNPFMFVKENAKVAVTNSSRGAHYMQRTSEGKTRLFYGDIKKCVNAAIKGRWEG
jgi:predicted aconitase